MKTNERSIATVFEMDDQFEVVPVTTAPSRGAMETELDVLKARLLKGRLEQMTQLSAAVPMRRAANEAAAMAWLTPYPLLVFPALFEEKTHRLLLQLSKQARVLARSESFIEAAA